MPSTPDGVLQVKATYAGALNSGDIEKSTSMFAPGAVIWHNYDAQANPADGAARSLDRLHAAMPDVRWEDVAVHATESGFVWQAVVVGTAPGGNVRAHTCMVVALSESGLIERIDEYLDPAALSALSVRR